MNSKWLNVNKVILDSKLELTLFCLVWGKGDWTALILMQKVANYGFSIFSLLSKDKVGPSLQSRRIFFDILQIAVNTVQWNWICRPVRFLMAVMWPYKLLFFLFSFYFQTSSNGYSRPYRSRILGSLKIVSMLKTRKVFNWSCTDLLSSKETLQLAMCRVKSGEWVNSSKRGGMDGVFGWLAGHSCPSRLVQIPDCPRHSHQSNFNQS